MSTPHMDICLNNQSLVCMGYRIITQSSPLTNGHGCHQSLEIDLPKQFEPNRPQSFIGKAVTFDNGFLISHAAAGRLDYGM